MPIRTRVIAGLGLISLLLVGPSAQAADGTISFTGEIVAANCTISAADTTVTLPKISTGAFGASGTRAGQTAFNIDLNCPTAGASGTNKVSVRFTGDGTQVDATSGLFLNTGTAKDVGIVVYDANDKWVEVAKNASTPPVDIVASSTGTTTIPLTAWYQSTAATVTAGTVLASGNIEIVYQ